MEVEKFINDWCKLINEDAEKRKNMWLLYKDFKMRIKESNTPNPIIEQEENGEYNITFDTNYWDNEGLKTILKNSLYGNVIKST